MPSSTSCEIMNVVCPVVRQMRRTSSCNVPRVKASSAENGSSISIIFGSLQRERARDADALLHAARQLRRPLVFRAGEPDQIDEFLRVRAHLAPGPLAP